MVCIILVDYNGCADTVECVKSLKKNTYKTFRIIVVDNGSQKDKSVFRNDFLKKNVDLIKTDKNLGFSGGNNFGIRYAQLHYKPDFFLLLNNDTVVAEDFIEKIVIEYNDSTSKRILTSKIKYYNNPNIIWFAGGHYDKWRGTAIHYGINEKDSGQYDIPRAIDFATGCVMLFSAQTFEILGSLSEEYFLYCEDTDYCLRAIKKHIQIYYVPSAVVYHKVSASTGKQLGLSGYYITRNRFLCIYRNLKGFQKLTAYCYSALVVGKAIFYKTLRFQTAKRALKDFRKMKKIITT